MNSIIEKYILAFLIGFTPLFVLHYFLEPTWKPDEPRPRVWRLILNYTLGTSAICASLLYLHPDVWKDLMVSVIGSASAPLMAYARDWLTKLVKRDQANEIIVDSKTKA